jgi:16S rRNA (uracil1498-N3)-methyltransferase
MVQFQRLAVAPDQISHPHIHLNPEQWHYLSRVLRLQTGDRFIAMDGQGHWWLAELEPQQARILEPIAADTELPIAITLIVAMPKGNGMDDIVRQTTELGVTCIAPVISDRTLLHPSPQKLDRWRRIAQEAAEQSERQIIPTIQEPIAFIDRLEQCSTQQRYLCVTRRAAPHLLESLRSSLIISNHEPTYEPVVVAIGCEGGWTNLEVEKAIASGFQPVSLGQRILRTVTAPLVALTIVGAAIEA